MDATRKRLLFRAQHRGMQETDKLIGEFAAAKLESMSEDQLAKFEVLLEESDNDLLNWITGRVPVPAEFDNDVMAMLLDHCS